VRKFTFSISYTPIIDLQIHNDYSPTPWNGLYCASKAAFHSLSEVLAMECKPFNIDVMLVAPGAVTSNIAKTQASVFHLPSDSLYTPYLENIIERMNASQSKASMPTAVFAKKLVVKALEIKPPAYITIGGEVLFFSIFKWLPRAWVFSLLWARFSKKRTRT